MNKVIGFDSLINWTNLLSLHKSFILSHITKQNKKKPKEKQKQTEYIVLLNCSMNTLYNLLTMKQKSETHPPIKLFNKIPIFYKLTIYWEKKECTSI